MVNRPRTLPQRVAKPVPTAFAVAAGDQQVAPPASPGTPRPAAWTSRTERVAVPCSVTAFWTLEPDVRRFEEALSAVASASLAAGSAGFDEDARARLHRAWTELREVATSGDFVPRSRIGTQGVATACEPALAALTSWSEADAARRAFELTGAILGDVLRLGRTVLVESTGHPPALTGQLMRVVRHVHPLPNERPTAEAAAELEEALRTLAEQHPEAASRDAFARCRAGLGS